MRSYVILAVVAVCSFSAATRTVSASNTAFDTAGDSAYNNGWTTGSNGGYGWGGWSFQAGDPSMTTTMQTASDPALGGLINSPSVPDGRAWAITNAAPTRQFASLLAPGQTFSVEMDGGTSGIAIGFFDPPDATQNFYITSINQRDYILWWSFGYRGGPSIEDTGVPAINGPVAISLSISETVDYVLDLQSLASTSISASIDLGNPHIPPGAVEMAGNNSSVLYVNNMSLTPEPSALCIAGVSALGLLRRRTRVRSGV